MSTPDEPAKRPARRRPKRTLGKWARRWAPIGALLGTAALLIEGTTGVTSLWDRFRPPSLDVLGARPIYIFGADPVRLAGDTVNFTKHGLGLVLKVQSGPKPVTISSTYLSGKLRMNFSDWSAFARDYMTNAADLEAVGNDLLRRKPYFRLQLVGDLIEPKAPVRLEPNEIAYLRALIIAPISYTKGLSTSPGYLGFDDGTKQPSLTKFNIEAHEFFGRRRNQNGTWRDVALPDDFLNGALRLFVTAGIEEIAVDPSKLRSLRQASEKEWIEGECLRLFLEDDVVYSTTRSPK